MSGDEGREGERSVEGGWSGENVRKLQSLLAEGFSYRKAAAILGVSKGAAVSIIRRVRQGRPVDDEMTHQQRRQFEYQRQRSFKREGLKTRPRERHCLMCRKASPRGVFVCDECKISAIWQEGFSPFDPIEAQNPSDSIMERFGQKTSRRMARP